MWKRGLGSRIRTSPADLWFHFWAKRAILLSDLTHKHKREESQSAQQVPPEPKETGPKRQQVPPTLKQNSPQTTRTRTRAVRFFSSRRNNRRPARLQQNSSLAADTCRIRTPALKLSVWIRPELLRVLGYSQTSSRFYPSGRGSSAGLKPL